jgi:predicted Ser/Thr protein kinase
MNEFRQALDAHTAGQIDLAALERTLTGGLTRQPQMAAAHGAFIEAVYRSGRIPGDTYLRLIEAVRSIQQAQSQPLPQSPTTSAPDEAGKTQFKMPAAAAQPANDPAATQFRAPRASSSQAVEPSQAEVQNRTGSGDAPAERSPTGSRPTGRSTGASWSDPGSWSSDGEQLGPGSIVKDRFVLEEELGRGGMGVVYKARDLRKEEAQDRNPWVALKLLNDEFRRHPESLKALQRESRKAQHLAHANVVTVYDFDRDGANVFMVMELLEGESLDRVIRDAEDGLPLKRALALIRGMCRAMAYAHEQGIVHSDFKPANAFLTKEGIVKVFDFGIARAAKRADNLTGSTTLFDPGSLGALTPTYASCEMIEGLEPDSRDDVYAIACVTYELLTGKHPFNRLSAVQARDKHMVAKRPRGLKRHQWRALRRGLAFDREQRTTSAQQFLNELLPRARRPTVHIGVAAAVVIALVGAATLVPGFLAKRRERMLIEELASADARKLDGLTLQLHSLSPEQRAALLLNERARGGLIALFESHINAATDINAAVTDYPRARALLDELREFLPDSLAVKDLEDRLVARENDEIKRLSDLVDEYLQRGLLIDAQGPENVGVVLASLRSIDAENRLLRDPRLPGAFAKQAEEALRTGNAELARQLTEAGLTFDSEDALLADLHDQAVRAVGEQRFVDRAQSLEASLAGALGATSSIADIDARRAEIDELQSLAPSSEVLADIQAVAQTAVGAESASLIEAGENAQALDLLTRYATLLPDAFVSAQRERLVSAQGASEAREAAVAQIETQIDGLLGAHSSEPGWAEQFDRELRRLSVYLAAADPYVVQVKERAAVAYLEDARELRDASRFAEAQRVLDQAREYAPRAADLRTEERLLADARSAREAASQERNRLAQLEALKHKLLLQARANEVTEALASLKELSANLEGDDPYLTTQAPQAIGAAYLRLASIAAKDGRFANAATLVQRAQEASPSLAGIDTARERYLGYQALDRTLQTASSINVAAVRGDLDRLARFDAAEVASVEQRLARNLVGRIRASTDPALVQRLTAAARELFDEESVQQLLSAPAATTTPPPAGAAVPAPDAQSTGPAAAVEQRAGAEGTVAGRAATSSGEARVAVARPAAEQGAVPRVAPDIPCAARLAGYGRRRQAICYDTFDGGGRGPDLVVIPASDGIPAFAFGRTELSNADYALYCTRTGQCKAPEGGAERPVTGISLEDAQNYLAWISSVSGAVYRLPTDSEWTQAAGAQGRSADRSTVNCSVEIGGKKVRGLALETVQSGGANAWGVYNALGNAQEWVVGEGFIAARGGAYSDTMSTCAVEASRMHAGSADPVTGVRVVREIG